MTLLQWQRVAHIHFSGAYTCRRVTYCGHILLWLRGSWKNLVNLRQLLSDKNRAVKILLGSCGGHQKLVWVWWLCTYIADFYPFLESPRAFFHPIGTELIWPKEIEKAVWLIAFYFNSFVYAPRPRLLKLKILFSQTIALIFFYVFSVSLRTQN